MTGSHINFDVEGRNRPGDLQAATENPALAEGINKRLYSSVWVRLLAAAQLWLDFRTELPAHPQPGIADQLFEARSDLLDALVGVAEGS